MTSMVDDLRYDGDRDDSAPAPAPNVSVHLTVKYRGRVFDLDVPQHDPLAQLSETLQQVIGVSRETQQLIGKGVSVKPYASNVRDTRVGEWIRSDATLTLFGQVPSDVADYERNMGQLAKQREPSAEHEERREAARRSASGGARGKKRSTKRGVDSSLFGKVVALEKGHGGRPLTTPSPSAAQALLERLATDPGIVGIMRDRGWQVGTLTEMLPDGKVGVDPVCVLGLNVNSGQRILLRLRTDDYRGLRRYSVIIDTLLHELAHNVHSDHGLGFRQLNSELQRDYRRRHDEQARSGHVLDPAAAAARRGTRDDGDDYDHDDDDRHREEAPKVLGGDSAHRNLSACEAARMAAIKRFGGGGDDGAMG